MDKSMVKNAADHKQVNKAKRSSKDLRKQELSDLTYIMASPQGRRFVWRLLGRCRTFGSIWETSAKIHYNAGQQDIGHFLMAELTQADEELFFNMMKENKEGELE